MKFSAELSLRAFPDNFMNEQVETVFIVVNLKLEKVKFKLEKFNFFVNKIKKMFIIIF
jgi:hypothetical protein